MGFHVLIAGFYFLTNNVILQRIPPKSKIFNKMANFYIVKGSNFHATLATIVHVGGEFQLSQRKVLRDARNDFVFYHDMQISWPDSGSPPIRLSDS